MKEVLKVLVVAVLCLSLFGCYTFHHKVGDGAQSGVSSAKKEWFILWGLVPMTNVDSQALAEGAENYDVKTQFNIEDVVITAFTGIITVHVQTVTVTK